MALTPGMQRQRDNTDTVLMQARVIAAARADYRAMAKACGLSTGLFFERLLETIEVDAQGRPIGIRAKDQHEELPLQQAS